jgi:hypothetical protein
MWLSTNKIPFEAMSAYLRAFFPYYSLKKRISEPFGASFATSESGSLRIWVREGRIDFRGFMRLLKLKVQYPGYSIECHALQDTKQTTLRGLERIINNTNPVWVKWIKANMVSLLRVETTECTPWSEVDILRIVLREQYAESWMKQSVQGDISIYQEYLKGIGLSEIEGWMITFGVEYS